MKATRWLRVGLLPLFAVGAAAWAPGCGDGSRKDGTLAPVLEADRAGLEKSAQFYKQNYMKKGAKGAGSRRR
jgi:hypothetical protein